MSRRVSGNMYSDSYDAMAEEFADPDVNCYTGMGAKVIYTRKKTDDSFKVHISNIPADLTEAGLLNIFNNKNFHGFNPYIGKSVPTKDTTWGFIEFKTFSEAQSAISTLNRQPPYNFGLKFARGSEKVSSKEKLASKAKNDNNHDFDSASVWSDTSTMSIARGRGVTPMSVQQDSFAKRQSSFIQRRPVEEPFFGEREQHNDYSEKSFMPPTDIYEFNVANKVNSRTTESLFDYGQRKVSFGRGSYIALEDNNYKNRIDFPDVASDLDTILSTYISQQYKKLSHDENLQIVNHGENPLSIVLKLGQCTCCNRPSLYVCYKCKAWYCSNSCRKLDYQQHAPHCFPRRVISFDSSGHLKLSDDQDEFADASELEVSLPSNGKKPESRATFTNKESLINGRNNAKEDFSDFRNSSSGNVLYEKGQHSRNNNSKNHGNSQRNNRYSTEIKESLEENFTNQKDLESLGNDTNEVDTSPRGFQRAGIGGNRGGKGKGQSSHHSNRGSNQRDCRSFNGGQSSQLKGGNDKKNTDNNRIEPSVRNDKRLIKPLLDNVENGIYKRRDHHSERKACPEGDSYADNPKVEPPIPYNQFSEVTVGAICSENSRKFWGYPNSINPIQAEIMKELSDASTNSNPIASKIIPGLRASAPFCGDWFRAEVKGFGPDDSVKVFFIDFGNECYVEKNNLKPLPPDIAKKPALAQLYILGESLNNPKFQEESTLSLMPIKFVDDAWLVHAEGCTYINGDPVEEVSILTVEDGGHFWVCKKNHKIVFEEMSVKLGEHKSIKVVPELNEVYALWNNKSWFRGKLIKKCPLSLFCIDVGKTITDVKKADLHPLPLKYNSVPPMAFKIKLSKDCINLFQLSEGSTIFIETIREEGNATLCKVLSSKPNSRASDISSCSSGKVSKELSNAVFDLKEGQVCSLWIEKIMAEDFFTGCIITKGNEPPFMEISFILSKKIKRNQTLGAKPGMSVAAFWDNSWYRGYVMMVRGSDPVVALTDRGRVVIPHSIAPLPEDVSIPESAVRVFVNIPLSEKIRVGNILKLKVIKTSSEKVVGEVEGIGEAAILPYEPMIEDAGLNVVHLKSGSKVIISAFTSPCCIYVQSAEKEDLIALAELMQDIATHVLQSEPLKRKPFSGELIAARYSDGQYYRAQIYKKQNNRYKIIFVDFGNSDWTTVSEMKPLSEGLKSIPCFALKVGLKGLPHDVPFNKSCISHLNDISVDTQEIKITFDNDLSQVSLDLENGENLNMKLADLLVPSYKKDNFNLIDSEVFMETDLEFEKWNEGSKYDVVVAKVISHNEIGVLQTDSDLLEYIKSTLIPEITKYCLSFDPEETYIPRISEVCLAMFEEDGKWYRGVNLGNLKNNCSEIYYVDYGNTGIVPHKYVRKMIPDFMDLPVAIKVCKIKKIPEQIPEDSKKRLMEYLLGLKTEVIVLEESYRTFLRIPSLEKFASVLNLSMKSPYIK